MASRVPLSPRSRLYYGTREWKEKQKRQKRKKERNKREKKRKGRKSLYGEREIEKKRNIFEKRGKCVRACAHICVYKSEREREYISGESCPREHQSWESWNMEIVPCSSIIQTLLYQTLRASTTHEQPPIHQPTDQPTNHHLGLLPVVRYTLFKPIPTALLLTFNETLSNHSSPFPIRTLYLVKIFHLFIIRILSKLITRLLIKKGHVE